MFIPSLEQDSDPQTLADKQAMRQKMIDRATEELALKSNNEETRLNAQVEALSKQEADLSKAVSDPQAQHAHRIHS